MKILFITDNFPPETNAPATRTYEHCIEWLKLGAKVTIITCVPNFPQGKVFKGYKNKFYQKENINGIEVIRVWSYITANEGFVKRIVDYVSFGISAAIAGLFIKTDIIVATSPQFFTTFAASFLSKVKRKPWIFELRDLWPESIKTVGAIQNNKIISILEKMEIFLYKDANAVIAVTDAFKKNLVLRGIDKNKIKIVYNGSNLEIFFKRDKNEVILKKFNLENKFVFGYIGTHGMAHSLDFIVNSLDKVYDKDMHFLFIGDGARKQDIIEIAKKKNLKNVTFLDSIEKNLVPEYLSIIDVALVPLKKSDTFKAVLPSKIFEASAMEKPILLGVEGQARELVEKYNIGVFFEPENESDFIAKTILIKNDIDLYKQLQSNCIKLSKDYDRKVLAKMMLYYLEEVLNEYR